MKNSDLPLLIFAGAIILFLMILIGLLFFIEIPEKNEPLITQSLGVVLGMVVTIAAFYFGSSKGSQDKDKNKMIERNGNTEIKPQ